MSEETNTKDLAADSQNGDVEGPPKKYKYPLAIPFIISNEFCERFNYYGMRTILSIYLVQQLLFSEDVATILYHSFTTLVYFCCVIGGIISDSWWGKFNTILYLSLVYVTGSIVITLGSVEPWNMPARTLTFIGLGLIALGSGGIKPCVAAFGGEQFKLPEQAKQLALFFSLFYFSINLGSFISTLVTPLIRRVACLGMDQCYPFGFGLPAALMALSIVIFIAGKFLYKILPNQGNMLVKVFRCISSAIRHKKVEKKTSPREHWLDYGETQYGKKLVMETKVLLNILVLYIPLPVFWALFDQQGSRWTFQATRMDGDLGFYSIPPEQVQVINPFLILVFIPLYEIIFYPLLNLIGIRRPLQKITLGGIFAGVAFLCSMGVEILIEPTYPVLPKAGESQLRFYNARECNYTVTTTIPDLSSFTLPQNDFYSKIGIPVSGEKLSFTYSLTSASCGTINNVTGELFSEQANSFFIRGSGNAITIDPFEDNPDKSRRGNAVVRVLASFSTERVVEFKDKKNEMRLNLTSLATESGELPPGEYTIKIGETTLETKVTLRVGGVYAIVIRENAYASFEYELHEVTAANSVSMLWLIPQYVIMTLGEVMYSVTGLQFSYTQAPESMKSVLQAVWLLTVAVGNLIVTIIVGAQFFNSQVYEFLLFALLMFVDMGIFAWLGYRYKPIPLEEIAKAERLEREGKKPDPLEFSSKED